MIQFKRILKAILKYRTSSVLTLFSLVISFVGIIILTLYVSFEKSFDQFHQNASLVYRLETKEYGSSVPAVITDVIQKKVPEVDQMCVFSFHDGKITTPELEQANTGFRSDMLFAGDSFFDLFSFPLLLGNRATALKDPYSVVLTESYAQKLFGQANPLGESVLVDNAVYKVTGVMKDFPKNSSFEADYLASFSTCVSGNMFGANAWSEWSFSIFMKLRDKTDPLTVADKIEQIPVVADNVKEMKAHFPNQPFIVLRPLEDIHYVNDGQFSYVNPVILNVLILLTAILAVMGAVNFINFSTSQAPLRAKALSVLQILGGKRFSSMGQIIAESVILSVCALVVSLVIYLVSYSAIETLFGISGLSIAGRPWFLLWFVLFAVGFGILAGLYPARYITSSPLAQSVKGNVRFSGKGKAFRNVLVTIQFIFTIALLASALVIEKQLNYWRNFDLGINKEHVVYMNTTNVLREHYQALANELMTNNNIADYTYSQFIPGGVGMGWGRDVDGQYIQLKCWPVDDRFLDFFGIKIAEGRGFAKSSQADVNTFILNKKAVEKFGWNNPLERRISGFDFTGQVIGVAENINFSSLKEEVEPMQFWLTDTRKNNLILRLNPGNYTQTLAFILNTARKFDPKNPLEVKFLDDALNKLYDKEERMAHFIEFVALWCMLLAVTGLLGLIIFICRDRIKEIGIRKVNGATITEVVAMLNRDIIRRVLIAFVLATPIAWYAMRAWLESFAYKTTLTWWIFVLAGLSSMAIALLTVSWQSWKAATRNPVEALRYE
ncbi:MAG: ABC transporter permease [Mangrovibacterium sp.]